MSETIRLISIVILFGLAFFCLFLNILPEEIAKRLSMDNNAKIADKIENASVLFADIVDFTKMTSTLDYSEAVEMEIKGKGEMKTYFVQ